MLKVTTVAAVVFSFIACDDDFETIGSNVIGEPGFNAELYDDVEITARTHNIGAVQTNNLQLNMLGVFEDRVFGLQEANVLSNLMLTTPNPSFGNEPVLDSVVLSIPYFSREVAMEEGTRFELDSVYGNGSIKLSITESRFYLNNFDPETNFEQAQKYYSNMEPRILSNLTSNVIYENDNFRPSTDPIVEFSVDPAGEPDTLSLDPAVRLHLDKAFFQSKILDKGGSAELLNQNNFRDYFRGIYIKAEQVSNDGTMMLLNLLHENAGITLYYRTNVTDAGDSDDDGNTDELVETRRAYKLGFGARVNTFNQEAPDFSEEDNLFLKGGEGSMAVIELFTGPDSDGDGVSDELEELRERNWLINEANLVFHVDRSFTADLDEPERIFIYNLNNNEVLADYILNAQSQSNTAEPIATHLPPLTKDEDGNGLSYKVRLTRHIDDMLNRDTENVRLGLVVSQNVSLVATSAVLPQNNSEVKMVPAASIITPEATVLYGPHAEDEAKRLKLNIYYTEPKN